MWREMYPDPRKMPASDKAEASSPVNGASAAGGMVAAHTVESNDTGIADGDFLPGIADEPVQDEKAKSNYWQVTSEYFIFWKVKPSKGRISPILKSGGASGGPSNDAQLLGCLLYTSPSPRD